jgi:DNA-binding NarL/FixJ family response regulator
VIRIAVIEDDPAALARMRGALAGAVDLQMVGEAASAAQGRALIAKGGFDVLLVDLGLPDGDGIDLIGEAARAWPEADIAVVTVFADHDKVLKSIRAGASGYLLKDDRAEDYAAHIRELRAGGSPISPIIARQLLRRFQPSEEALAPDLEPLSEREAHVLDLLARGFAYAEIARLLAVSPHTIGTYIKRLYRKLQVHSRSEAVYEAQKLGLLDKE